MHVMTKFDQIETSYINFITIRLYGMVNTYSTYVMPWLYPPSGHLFVEARRVVPPMPQIFAVSPSGELPN
jgi:hypothetical protein